MAFVGTGGGAKTQQRQPARSGMFTNLQDYLRANVGAGERMAGQIMQPLQQQEAQFRTGAQTALREPLNVQRDLLAEAKDFQRRRQELGTEGGQIAALRGIESPQATFGESRLNQILLGGPGARGQFRQDVDMPNFLRERGTIEQQALMDALQQRVTDAQAAYQQRISSQPTRGSYPDRQSGKTRPTAGWALPGFVEAPVDLPMSIHAPATDPLAYANDDDLARALALKRLTGVQSLIG